MSYTRDMQDRGKRMLELANEPIDYKSVIDVGCGNQQLKVVVKELHPKVKYTGRYRLNHKPDTLIADFNKGEYPKVEADLAIVSGVFEYIQPEMIDSFLDNVCHTAPVVAFSYWPIDYYRNVVHTSSESSKKRPKVWVNHYRLSDFIAAYSVLFF